MHTRHPIQGERIYHTYDPRYFPLQVDDESQFLRDVKQARDEAVERYPQPRNSYHEAYALMKEEFDEVWDELRKKDCDPASLYIELTHLVSTAWRFAVECGLIES